MNLRAVPPFTVTRGTSWRFVWAYYLDSINLRSTVRRQMCVEVIVIVMGVVAAVWIGGNWGVIIALVPAVLIVARLWIACLFMVRGRRQFERENPVGSEISLRIESESIVISGGNGRVYRSHYSDFYAMTEHVGYVNLHTPSSGSMSFPSALLPDGKRSWLRDQISTRRPSESI